MKPKRTTGRVVVVIGLALLVVVSAFEFRTQLFARRVRAPGELDLIVRRRLKPVPWFCTAIGHLAEKAVRAHSPALIPPQLLAYTWAKALKVSSEQSDAQWKLFTLNTNAWPATAALLAGLDAENPEVRSAAFEALLAIRADENPEFDRLATALAGKRRPAEALVSALRFGNSFGMPYGGHAKRLGLALLAACGPGAGSAYPFLLATAKSDSDYQMRSLAVTALGALGPAARQSAPFLRLVLQNPAEWPLVRGAAACSLAAVARDDKATSALLQVALMDKEAMVRTKAADALWRLGTPPDNLLPILAGSLTHKLASVRCASLTALAHMGRAALPTSGAVQDLLLDEQVEVRWRASIALNRMGIPADSARTQIQ